eukprot:6191237-Pleurochrysis_carterae.AAC.3
MHSRWHWAASRSNTVSEPTSWKLCERSCNADKTARLWAPPPMMTTVALRSHPVTAACMSFALLSGARYRFSSSIRGGNVRGCGVAFALSCA